MEEDYEDMESEFDSGLKNYQSPEASLSSSSRPSRPPDRKQLRKQGRQLKKMKKLAYSQHKPVPKAFELPRKKVNQEQSDLEMRKRIKENKRRAVKAARDEEKAANKAKELIEKKKQERIQRLMEENEEDDKLIRKLEKKLHLKKRNKKKVGVPASFSKDGLGYLLEVLENPNAELEDMEENAEETAYSDEEEMEDFEQAEEIDVGGGVDEDSNLDSDVDSNGDEEEKEHLEQKPREDIYGRLRDESGKVIQNLTVGKYVPPALKSQDEKSESQKLLKRQIKGLFNRLTQATLAGILSQMIELFNTNSRHDMNEIICNTVVESCVTRALTPKRLALEYAMFMGLLYQNVGPETGAIYIQNLLAVYDSIIADVSYFVEDDKRLDNVVTLWCHSLSFKLIHASMIFELLNEFVGRFAEKDIDMILIILREVGFCLRKDDPTALKMLIELMQTKADDLRQLRPEMGSRLSFMLDTLIAIKNNNVTKIPNYDPSEVEHAVKTYRGLLRKTQLLESELKISLADLRNADQRGKWWIVGAAWTNSADFAEKEKTVEDMNVLEDRSVMDRKLLQLAAKQRMNTDIRRAIFCAIMSAEDYSDAFERVLKLNLKNAQEAEIIHVLVHCCMQEKSFNPFYAFVLEKFCSSHRRFQRQLLYSLWDKMRDLDSLSAPQQKNLAHLISHGLIEKQAIPIVVLKKLNFADMNAALMKFLRVLLARVVLIPKEDQLKLIFGGLWDGKYKAFRESLRLFIRHFMTRNCHKILKGEFANVEKSAFEKRIVLCEKVLLGESHLDS